MNGFLPTTLRFAKLLASGLLQLYMMLAHFVFLIVSPAFTLFLFNRSHNERAHHYLTSFKDAVDPLFTAIGSLPWQAEVAMRIAMALVTILFAITFIIIIVNVPLGIAKFHMGRVSVYLFIDAKKTLRHLAMTLLPAAYFLALTVFDRMAAYHNLIESMLLANISTTGVFLAVFIFSTARSRPEGIFPSVLWASSLAVSAILLVAVVATSWALVFVIEDRAAWLVVFHLFLAQSVYVNARFYRDNIETILVQWERRR